MGRGRDYLIDLVNLLGSCKKSYEKTSSITLRMWDILLKVYIFYFSSVSCTTFQYLKEYPECVEVCLNPGLVLSKIDNQILS